MDAPTEHTNHIRRFTTDMATGVDELARLGYPALILQRMLVDHGAVEAARRLVLDPKPSYGLWGLRELNRPGASVEMWVLLPWYEPLCSTSRFGSGRNASCDCSTSMSTANVASSSRA